MTRALQILALVAAGAAAVASAPNRQLAMKSDAARRVTSGEIRSGMPAADARQRLGPPEEYSGRDGAEVWHYYEYDYNDERTSESIVVIEAGVVTAFERRSIRRAPAGPAVVVVAPGGFASTGQRTCRRHSDCASGEWCRDRGDGHEVCMGEGRQGASCTRHGDCASGLWCRDRGDGYEVCMGEGRRGDYCTRNGDCDDGFCRSAGGRLKTCQ